MGVLLDTSVVVRAERLGWDEGFLLRKMFELVGDEESGIPSVVLAELLHGIYREPIGPRRTARRAFLRELTKDVPVAPFGEAAAELVGRIGAEQASVGTIIPFPDLMIGATALSLGYAILTSNVRHFRMIPGLRVIEFQDSLGRG
jgi:tRNA(fMet)-specific endonuclease VapC